MSRQLKRLQLLGLIKMVSHTNRYSLTRMGRAAIAAACSLTRMGRAAIAAACSLTRFTIVPAMAATN